MLMLKLHQRGIMVLHNSDANTGTVAEHTRTYRCNYKDLLFLDKETRDGNKTARRLYLPIDLDGKTLGVIGYGRIGNRSQEGVWQPLT